MNESSPFHEPDLMDTNMNHFEEKSKTKQMKVGGCSRIPAPLRVPLRKGEEVVSEA